MRGIWLKKWMGRDGEGTPRPQKPSVGLGRLGPGQSLRQASDAWRGGASAPETGRKETDLCNVPGANVLAWGRAVLGILACPTPEAVGWRG